MGRRILAQGAFVLSLLVILMLQSTSVVYADNCGSLSDCFPTTEAAAAVAVAVAVLIALAVLALPQLLETTTTPDTGSDVPQSPPEPAAPFPLPPVPPAPEDPESRLRREEQTSPTYPPAQGPRQGFQEHHPALASQHAENEEASRHPFKPGESAAAPAEPQVQVPRSVEEVQVPRAESEVQVLRSDVEVQIPRPGPAVQAPFVLAPGPDAAANRLLGIHHVTAIASDPQRNIDFYTGLLGLRLIKATVNFDEPNTYQFYYGDMLGHPGTILSFFCWPNAPRGTRGTGQVIALSFSVPAGTFSFWAEYLMHNGIAVGGPSSRFDDQVLSIFDPDGLQIDLVTHLGTEARSGWSSGRVPLQCAIRGLYSVSISVARYEQTAALLSDLLRFQQIGVTGSRHRYQTGNGKPGTLLDVLSLPTVPGGSVGVGTVHHVGWRTPGDAQQLAWSSELSSFGLNVSPIMSRLYYNALYFREPGGILFDIATDTPGFTVDENPELLGTHLMLPLWLEPQRSQIVRALPPLRLPTAGQGR